MKTARKCPKNCLRDSRTDENQNAIRLTRSPEICREEILPTIPASLDQLYYPTSHRGRKAWLKHFLENRFELFGDYEDAIVEGESWLWHSVLTPCSEHWLADARSSRESNSGFCRKKRSADQLAGGFYSADHRLARIHAGDLSRPRRQNANHQPLESSPQNPCQFL